MSTPALPWAKPKLPVTVEKPTPYSFDLGLLLANDPNPITVPAENTEEYLASVARDGAQALINQLLTTCPISSGPDAVTLSLPPPHTPLPREKPLPAAKPPTKWEQFAARKGIKPKTREQRANRVFDEATGEWRRKWGYQGANKDGQSDWLVEVDEKKESQRAEGTTVRGDSRRERKENLKRNERRMRKNLKAAGKKG